MKFAKLLKILGCVLFIIVLAFLLDRRFTQEGDKYQTKMKMLEKESSKLWGEVDDVKKLVEELEKKSQSSQLQEVLLLKWDVNELLNKVDEMKKLSQQQLEEVSELENKFRFLCGESREIHERIQKLQNQEISSTPAPP